MWPHKVTENDKFDSVKARQALLKYTWKSASPKLFFLLQKPETRANTWDILHKLAPTDLQQCIDALLKRNMSWRETPLQLLCQDKTFFLDFLIQINELDTKLSQKAYLSMLINLAEPPSTNPFNSLLGQYLTEASTSQLLFDSLKKHEALTHPLIRQACIALTQTDKLDLKEPHYMALYEIAVLTLQEEKPEGLGLYQACEAPYFRPKILKWLIHYKVLDSAYSEMVFSALTKRVLDTSYRPHRLISPLSYLLCGLTKYPEYRHLLSHPKLIKHPRYINYLFDTLDREALGENTIEPSFDKDILSRIEGILEQAEIYLDLNTLTATGLPLIAAAAKHGHPALVLKMMELGADITLPYHWSSLHYEVLYSIRGMYTNRSQQRRIKFSIPKTLRGNPKKQQWKPIPDDTIEVSASTALRPFQSRGLPAQNKVHSNTPLSNLTHGHHFERGALYKRYGFLSQTSSTVEKLMRSLSELNRQVITTLTFGESNTAHRLFETGLTTYAISYRHIPLYQVKTRDNAVHEVTKVYYDDAFIPARRFARNFVHKNYRLLKSFFTAQVASFYKAGNCETHREIAFMSLFFSVDQAHFKTISLAKQETKHNSHFFVLINAGNQEKLSACHALPDSAILVDPYLDIVATKKDILRKYFSNYQGHLTQSLVISPADYTIKDKVALLLVLSRLFFAYAITDDEPIQQLALGFAASFMQHAAQDQSTPEYPLIKELLSDVNMLEQCVSYHAILNNPGTHPFIYGTHPSPFSKTVKTLYWQCLTMKDLTLSEPILTFEVAKVGYLNSDVILRKCRLLKLHIDKVQGDEGMSDKLADFIDIRGCYDALKQLEAKPLYFSPEMKHELSKLFTSVFPWLEQHIEKQDKMSDLKHPAPTTMHPTRQTLV